MKCKHFLLTALVMLCWVGSAQAAITTSYQGGDLLVHTDQKGVAGYKGCDSEHMKKMPAYIFELQQKGTSANPTCGSGRWRTVSTKNDGDGQVTFEDVPEGYYRVRCLVAKAIGCYIEGVESIYPDRSVVYEQEISEAIRASLERGKETAFQTDKMDVDGLLVYPNPASDEITIVLKKELANTEVTISLVDLLGKIVQVENHKIEHPKKEHLWTIKVSTLPTGTYVVLLRDNNELLLQQKIAIIRKG